jgi:membrane-associated phospholipid phosphatase
VYDCTFQRTLYNEFRQAIEMTHPTNTLTTNARQPEPRGLSLGTLLICFGGVYLLSAGALRFLGRPAAVPWGFVPYLLLIALPVSLATASALAFLPRLAHLEPIPPSWRLPCIAAGLTLTYWSGHFLVWISAAVALGIVTLQHWNRDRLATAALAAITVTLGYGCVWNANYLLAVTVNSRLHDAVFVGMDAKLLGREYNQLFPLWTDNSVYKLLENSYAMLFPQVIAVVLVVSTTHPRRTVAGYIRVLFTAYAIGLAIFAVFPAVGPPIYIPTAFRSEFSDTFTANLMRAMATEYHQLQQGGKLNGFGYFVAFPSLHVAAAVILQRCMRQAPLLYWTWAPVTCLLILSTVVLGYHYLLDVPAGFLLGFLLCKYLPDSNNTYPS